MAQTERLIEIWRRAGDDWACQQVRAGSARLESVDCELLVDEVYRSRLSE